jgi:hypothetical protein
VGWILPVAAAWLALTVPGWLLLALTGSRLPFRWGYAPAVTCVLVAVLTSVHKAVGIAWTGASGLVSVLLVAAACVGGRRLLAARRRRDADRDASDAGIPGPRGLAKALVPAGALLGGLLIVVPAASGMGSPSSHNDSYDAFFHHSATAFIRDSGDAFALTALAPIYGGEPTYYPSTWHAIASVLPFEVVVAANAMVLASLAVIPGAVAALLLTVFREQTGPSRDLVIAAVAVSCSLFLSIPTMGLFMGLWPYLLGLATFPAALGALVAAAAEPARGTRRLSVAHLASPVLVVAGSVVAHPTVLFSIAAVLVVAWACYGVQQVLRPGARARGTMHLAALTLGMALYAFVFVPRISTMDMTEPPPSTLLSTLLVVLADRPRVSAIPFQPLYMVPLLLLAGPPAVPVLRRRSPLLVIALLTALLGIVMTYSAHAAPGLFSTLTSPWYGAPERVAPIFQIGLVVLATGGALMLCDRVERPALLRRALPAVLALVLVACSVTAALDPHRIRLIGSMSYPEGDSTGWAYLAPPERDFIEEQSAVLPEDAVVLGVPRDGTPAFWFLGGVEVMLPTLSPAESIDERRVATYGYNIDDDLDACRSAERVGVTHLYRDGSASNGEALGDDVDFLYRGIAEFPDELLTETARQGDYVLYEVELPC